MASSARPIAFKSPAIVRWIRADGETKHLSLRDPEPACKVVADVRFLPCERTALLRLHVPVLLEAAARATNVYMFIQPQHITQLRMANEHVPETVQHGFIANGSCASVKDIGGLRFAVQQGSTVAVPKDSSLKPRKDSSATLLQLLFSLSQCKSFTIYYPRDSHLVEPLETLCTLASAGQLAPIVDDYALERLYHGKGARIVEQSPPDETTVDSPPSYDEIGPSPPLGSSKRGLRSNNSPSSRPGPAKRAKVTDLEWRSSVEKQLQTILAQLAELQDSTRAPPSQPADANARQPSPSSQIDHLRQEVELIKQSLEERSARLSAEFTDLLDTFRTEMIELINTRDVALMEQIEEAKNEMAGHTSEQVDDRLLDVKCEMQGFVEEHLEEVAAKLKEKIKQASILIDFDDND